MVLPANSTARCRAAVFGTTPRSFTVAPSADTANSTPSNCLSASSRARTRSSVRCGNSRRRALTGADTRSAGGSASRTFPTAIRVTAASLSPSDGRNRLPTSYRGGRRMVRTMLRPALALGAVLAVGGYAAADDTLRLGGPGAKSGFGADTLSLVGKGTLADAAAEDTELTYSRGGYRGGG